MQRIHLDTDLGGDTDDLCALALLLRWPDVELTGITTCTEHGGQRAGLVEYALRLAGRGDIPVAAGAEGSLGGFYMPAGIADVARYWPDPVPPRPSPPGAALDLLARSVAAGASIIAIGPYTNLALLEAARPGLLASAEVVVMGGYVTPPPPGYPDWDASVDYNVQQDTLAARIVFERCDPLIVQLSVTLGATLPAADLPRLRASGLLGALLARQAELHAADNKMPALGRAHQALPDDLLNFHYDPLACAVALGWDGARVETLPLLPVLHDGVLSLAVDPAGRPARVVTDVDGERFSRDWLDTVTREPGTAADG